MKTLLKINLFALLFLVILSLPIKAATDTLDGYWTETVEGDVSALDQDGFISGLTATSDTLAITSNSLVSNVFGYTSAANATAERTRNHISNKKILVGINVTVAYDDVAATLIVEGSGDGTNWATIATASSDTTPNVTGVKWYLVDLTGVYLPYFRLIFNKGGLNCGVSGKLKFLYMLPQPNA